MKKSNLLLVLLLYLAITSCARLDTPVVPEDSAIPPMTSTFVTEEAAVELLPKSIHPDPCPRPVLSQIHQALR